MQDKIVTCKLTDGRDVLIRRPLADKDLDRLIAFFAQLPPEVKNHLRYDVGSDRAASEGRLRQVDQKDHWRLVAELQDGTFIADATMDREPYGWTRHVASVRTVVSPSAENLGIRQAMCEEMVRIAQTAGIERLETQILAEDVAYLGFLEAAGFTKEFVRRNHARGVDGKLHDLVIMSNDLASVWKRLEDSLQDMDVQFARWSGLY